MFSLLWKEGTLPSVLFIEQEKVWMRLNAWGGGPQNNNLLIFSTSFSSK